MVKKIIGLGLVLCMLLTCTILPTSVDAAEMANISVLKTVADDTAANQPYGMCKTDKYAFVRYQARIEVIDIQNPASPSKLTTIDSATGTKQNIVGIFVKGNYLIVAYKSNNSRADEISIYNVSQIAQNETLEPVARSASEDYLYTREMLLTLDGDTLYILTKDGLNEVDVSLATIQAAETETIASREAHKADPSKPVNITTISVNSVFSGNAIVFGKFKDYTYNGTADSYDLYDSGDICKSGDYLYYTVASNYGLFLCMLKVDGANSQMIGFYPLFDSEGVYLDRPTCRGIVAQGTKVYAIPCASNNKTLNYKLNNLKHNALFALDAETAMNSGTAEAPVELTLDKVDIIGGTYSVNSALTALALNGDQLYVWGSGKSVRGIYMYDLTSEKLTRTKVFNPIGVTGFVNEGDTHGTLQRSIIIEGDMMYSVDGLTGLVINRMPANEVTAPVVNNGIADIVALEDGSLKAKTTITNYSSDDYSGLIIIAHYEKVGELDKLVDLKATSFTVPAGKIGYAVESDALAVSAGTSVKAMVWSNWDGIAPIVAPTTIVAE